MSNLHLQFASISYPLQIHNSNRDVSARYCIIYIFFEFPAYAIKNPRQSRGFFICGRSPRILACASRRASTVCQPRKFCYLPPVNGRFKSPAWSVALLLCPARTVVGCTPVFSLHFFLQCPRSTRGTRIPGSGISIFAPGTSRTTSGYSFLLGTP